MNRQRPRTGAMGYRQLQAFAKVMKLPGNVKYEVLMSMVQARQAGDERRVNELLAEQKRTRLEKRIKRKVARIHEENDKKTQTCDKVIDRDQPSTSEQLPQGLTIKQEMQQDPHWYEHHAFLDSLSSRDARIQLLSCTATHFFKCAFDRPSYHPEQFVHSSPTPFPEHLSRQPGQARSQIPFRRQRPSTQNLPVPMRMAVHHNSMVLDPVTSDDHGPWDSLDTYYQNEEQILQPQPTNYSMGPGSIQVTSTNYIHYSQEVCISSSVVVPPSVQILNQQYEDLTATEEQTFYVGSAMSNASDTQSASEVVDEDFCEMDFYSGLDPYIEEVICSNYEDVTATDGSENSGFVFSTMDSEEQGDMIDSKIVFESSSLTTSDDRDDSLAAYPPIIEPLIASSPSKLEDDQYSTEGDLEIVIPEEIDHPLDHKLTTNDLLKVVSP